MEREAETKRLDGDRRRFLENCGRFAVVTPPTVALMLSATGSARALSTSAGTMTFTTTSTSTTASSTTTVPTSSSTNTTF